MPGVFVLLPSVLAAALWTHVRRELPRECVGALGGWVRGEQVQVRALYPLPNVSPQPEREYLADPGELLRVLRAMQREGLELVALYHSHPHGPAAPSSSDRQLAAYPVPYLIADPRHGHLRAYLLPGGEEVEIRGAE
ncbi:Mov34/MPN/PAD-1 family protein [Deinococcus wulumuqiensis]|uniref:MPN domain-containing protein n=1 Tax=Deinococcus wulumuqiensis TaxID=980427 RepID=A0AAV4K4A7_9DEIO|nr:M67 family metallopeptidase [Deinococcus wulumuqiensis]QII21857.1 M67 family metallopeptidase [Deinococcus wulumuqiensis R12]GGI79740.1 hypothetical protein GCM10010914_12390 [Deinococcus wulumuqiensis]GGP28994.1 hypothetical protein GCM10008021_06450 [Deinococcus wulumuqiensis]